MLTDCLLEWIWRRTPLHCTLLRFDQISSGNISNLYLILSKREKAAFEPSDNYWNEANNLKLNNWTTCAVIKRKINFHRTRYDENASVWTALLQLLCKRERKVYWISILYLSRKSASCSSYSHLWPSCNQVLHASDFITSIPLRIGSKLHCSLSLDEKYIVVCLLTIRYSRKKKKRLS